MADQTNHEDRLADRNLRMIGQRLQLPADPTERQQAAWKRASEAPRAVERPVHPSIPERGARFVRRHRFLAAATSAVAAAIVLAVLLATPRGAVVEAHTIFNSLRQTLLDGFQITLEKIGDEGVWVDGKVLVALQAAKGMDATTGVPADPSRLGIESVYAEVRVRGDGLHPKTAGLDLQAVLALHDGVEWVYVKIGGLPNELLEESPTACMFVSLAGGGLLLDVDGVRDLLDADRLGLQAAAARRADRGPARPVNDEDDLSELYTDFLYGRAGGQQIDRVVTLLAESARDVAVAEVEPGLHVLTARDFTLEAGSADAKEVATLARIVLEVAYRKGRGIEWVVVRNVGAYDGTLRLAPIGDRLDPALFDKGRLIEPGVTTVVDLSGLQPMLEQMIGGDD